MLHALLHGKLDETNPEPQRLEDALTSTVFGALVWLEQWELLATWLRVPWDAATPSGGPGVRETECWFWPRMDEAEPDVALRLGNILVVVEAKYQSGRHDLTATSEADEHHCDQIVRQYVSITKSLSARSCYADKIERAIRECLLVQAFVVDARHQRRARREWGQSKTRLPREASLQFVTWQALFRKLSEGDTYQRWRADLREYLQRCGLDTFDGISRGFMSDSILLPIRVWCSGSSGLVTSDIRTAVKVHATETMSIICWGVNGPSKSINSLRFIKPAVIERSKAVIFAWKAPNVRDSRGHQNGERDYS